MPRSPIRLAAVMVLARATLCTRPARDQDDGPMDSFVTTRFPSLRALLSLAQAPLGSFMQLTHATSGLKKPGKNKTEEDGPKRDENLQESDAGEALQEGPESLEGRDNVPDQAESAQETKAIGPVKEHAKAKTHKRNQTLREGTPSTLADEMTEAAESNTIGDQPETCQRDLFACGKQKGANESDSRRWKFVACGALGTPDERASCPIPKTCGENGKVMLGPESGGEIEEAQIICVNGDGDHCCKLTAAGSILLSVLIFILCCGPCCCCLMCGLCGVRMMKG